MDGNAFYFMTATGILESNYGGILPDPIELPVSYPIIDGKVEEVTATSGQLQYLIVEPGDYPNNQSGRDRRQATDNR